MSAVTGPGPRQPGFAALPQPLYAATPSRLLAWLDCPRRYRMTYLDRPRPAPAPQRAHTSVGIATHAALRDIWDVPVAERTPAVLSRLVERSWSSTGFRDQEQSARWRDRVCAQLGAYWRGGGLRREPAAVERVVAFRTDTLAFSGRVDRLDDRDGELVVVDYKTGRRPLDPGEARTSMALGLYAAAAGRVFRRPCGRVELHHLPTGTVVAHEHTDASLRAKVDEAESIVVDLRRADAAFRQSRVAAGVDGRDGQDGQDGQDAAFPAQVGPLCPWCDVRAYCPSGQRAGPEEAPWAGLADDGGPLSSDRT